jgi:hypothetical protein
MAGLIVGRRDCVFQFHEKTYVRLRRGSACAIRSFRRANEVIDIGGEPGWDRTNDPLIKSQMLYR